MPTVQLNAEGCHLRGKKKNKTEVMSTVPNGFVWVLCK